MLRHNFSAIGLTNEIDYKIAFYCPECAERLTGPDIGDHPDIFAAASDPMVLDVIGFVMEDIDASEEGAECAGEGCGALLRPSVGEWVY